MGANAWKNRGNGFVALGRNEDAIVCYDKALAINPKSAEAWKGKGNALNKLARSEEATKCIDKGLAIHRRYVAALILKAALLAKSGRHEQAISYYEQVLAIDPEQGLVWHGKALSEDILRRSLEAVRSYRKFIEFASAKDANLIADVRQRIHELESKLV